MRKAIVVFALLASAALWSCAPLNESDISDISIQLPSAPSNVQATTTNESAITVSWNAVSGADYYNVYRGDSIYSFESSPSSKVSGTTYSDTKAYAGDTVLYKVSAVCGGVEGEKSFSVYGTRKLKYGAWSDVEAYGNAYPLVYDETDGSLYDVHQLEAGYYVRYYFPVVGGEKYTVTIYDKTRNPEVFETDDDEVYTPATTSVRYFAAGADKAGFPYPYVPTTVQAASGSEFTSEITGYYCLEVSASTAGWYMVIVE